MRDCKNFKVRINAALALTTPHKRCQYGDATMFLVVWKGLMEALETAEDISDYIDFRYRDSLTDQVCIGPVNFKNAAKNLQQTTVSFFFHLV